MANQYLTDLLISSIYEHDDDEVSVNELEKMIEAGADINGMDSSMDTPLKAAIFMGREDVLYMLVAKKVIVKNTDLIYAIECFNEIHGNKDEYIGCFKGLLDGGAELTDIMPNSSETILQYLMRNEIKELIEVSESRV